MEPVRQAPAGAGSEARQPAGAIEYQAFISYAREDGRIARKLHRALEAYRLPPGFGESGPVPSGAGGRTLYPCFLDTDELRGGGLPDQIRQALRRSGALIVVCSRASVANEWVNAEISEFLDEHSPDRVFPVLVDDMTLVEDDVEGIFPVALRLAISGKEAGPGPMTRWQPLAADLRLGRDGFAFAVLKLVAGIKGLRLRDLAERQFRRARSRRLTLSAALAAIMILGARFLGDTIHSTGFQEVHSRAENAIAQLKAWQRLQEIISMGDDQQSLKALVGFDAECSFSFGACGYYDEEFKYTAQRIRLSSETSEMTLDEIAKLLGDLQEKIETTFDRNHRRKTDIELPEGIMFARRNFSDWGSLTDPQGNLHFYRYDSMEPRGEYYRVAYALVPFNSVPDIRRGEAIQAWGTWIPVMFLAFHALFEILRFGRLFRRPTVLPEAIGAR